MVKPPATTPTSPLASSRPYLVYDLSTIRATTGWLASRYPKPRLLYRLVVVSGLLVALVPLLSAPLLDFTAKFLAETGSGQFWRSLISLSLRFAVPSILLSIINPFALQLRLNSVGRAGKTTGNISALTMLGNLAGVFATVLLILPAIGTRNTLFSLQLW